jgi:predicted ATPase
LIESIRIRNFRGLRECEVGGLTDVNVIIGRNGSGKSTVLEAIYLASSWAEPADPLRGLRKVDYVVQRRGGRGGWSDYRDSLWFSKELERDIEVELRFRGSTTLRFRVPYATSTSEPVFLELGPDLYYNLHSDVVWKPATKQLYNDSTVRSRLPYWKEAEYLRGVVLLDSRLRVEDVESRVWSRVLDRRLDRLVVELVRGEYEPNAESIVFKPVGGRFVLAVTLSNTTVEVDALGDGARLAVVLASALTLLSGTAVLVEDPEVHQHPGGLSAVLRFALRLARERSLQLFITTHSAELVNLVMRLCGELGLGARLFFIERDHSTGVAEVRTLESLDVEVLQKIGFDPRLLHVL